MSTTNELPLTSSRKNRIQHIKAIAKLSLRLIYKIITHYYIMCILYVILLFHVYVLKSLIMKYSIVRSV